MPTIALDIGNPFGFLIMSVFLLCLMGAGIAGMVYSIRNLSHPEYANKKAQRFITFLFVFTLSAGLATLCLSAWLAKYFDVHIF